MTILIIIIIFLSSLEDTLIDFREGRKEGEREKEQNINVGEKQTSIGCLSYTPRTGTEHAT